MENNLMAKEWQKKLYEKNYRRNASLARRPPPAAFALTFGKNISGNDDRFDDDDGEDNDDDDKLDDLDDGVEDLDDVVEDPDDYDEDKPEVQQQSLLPEQPLS